MILGMRSNGRNAPYLKPEINFDQCLHLAQSVVDNRVATSTTPQIENVTLPAELPFRCLNSKDRLGSFADMFAFPAKGGEPLNEFSFKARFIDLCQGN